MKSLMVLTDAENAGAMIDWAGRLPSSRFGPLTILCCFKGHPIQPLTPLTPERLISGEGLLRAVHQALNASDGDPKDAVIAYLWHPDPVTAVLETLETNAFDFLIIGTEGRMGDGTGDASFAERLFRFAPCETLLVDPAPSGPIEKRRILVPMGSSMRESSLSFALDLAQQGGTVVPLLVGPAFGADARATARKELELKLREIGMGMSDKFVPDVVVAPDTMQGLVRALHPEDTMLITASSAQVLHRFHHIRRESETETEARGTLLVYSPARKERVTALMEWLARYLPRLNSTERVRVFDQLLAGARFNPDFLIMMAMATAIAALGLLQNSGAVVIGAMLVAPLMSPLIGAGFALVQGNIRLFRFSIRSIALGILFGFALSVLIGFLNPNEDFTAEIMARTGPEVRDMLVAFLSGAAAAYAFARPGLAGTLAGVAIAAALVPPLATAGIGLSRGAWRVFEGAAILHVTNLVAITLGAAATFRLLGIQGIRLGIGPALWARRSILVLSLAAVLLSAPLFHRSAAKIMEGPTRPMAYPLSTVLHDALRYRIEQEPGLELILSGRSPVLEKGIVVGILLAAEGPVPPELRTDLRQIVKETIGMEAHLKIYTLQKAGVKTE